MLCVPGLCVSCGNLKGSLEAMSHRTFLAALHTSKFLGRGWGHLDTLPDFGEGSGGGGDLDIVPDFGEGGLDTVPDFGEKGLDTVPDFGEGGLDTVPDLGEGGLDTVPDFGEGGLDTVPDLGEGDGGIFTHFQIGGGGWGCLYTLPDFGEGERDLLWMTVSESFCKILVVVSC